MGRVKLGQLKGVGLQAVADALEIHPFMLSRWRKEPREGRLRGAVALPAVRRRQPARGLILHTDRGSEFLGAPLKTRFAQCGVRQSMTRGGAPGENPHVESFFHSFKTDMVHGCRLQTIGELRSQLRWYLPFYNHERLHSGLGYHSPVDYERRGAQKITCLQNRGKIPAPGRAHARPSRSVVSSLARAAGERQTLA